MKNQARLLSLAAASLFASGVNAQNINFDEFPADDSNGPMAAERYSSLGIHFIATDDGSTWGGISNGDPGNWDIDGTSGPIFSGFNGNSYGLKTVFDAPVSAFTLDVSRSNGSAAGDEFTLTGYLNGNVVESHTVLLGDLNQWTTITLAAQVDSTAWGGAGQNFHPYGVDNLRWNGETRVPDAGVGFLGWGCAFLALGMMRRVATK